MSLEKNLQGRTLIVLKYDLWYKRNLYDLSFSVFQLLILLMKAEFFKNSNFDATSDFGWNSIEKAAEFTPFCNTANVLRQSDQSNSNHVSSWIIWITSQPIGNFLYQTCYQLKSATLRLCRTMQCDQNSNYVDFCSLFELNSARKIL